MTAVTVDKKGADLSDMGPVFNTLTDMGVDPKVITKLICCRRPGCSVCGGSEYNHGPYYYAYFVNPVDKKRSFKYLRPVDKKRG